MHQPSFLGVVAAPSRKVPELGLGAAAFGALLLIAFALPSHVLAHEAHPPAQPARAAALDAANAEGAPPLQKGPWPIRNGLDYQPTEQELRALHQEDVTPDQAREIDRLYDQLLASNDHRAGWSQVLADPLIDTGRAVLDNAPIVQVQPRASQFLPGSSADQAEQRRESKFDAEQRELDEEFDNNLNICKC
jgi:hypothetical protein